MCVITKHYIHNQLSIFPPFFVQLCKTQKLLFFVDFWYRRKKIAHGSMNCIEKNKLYKKRTFFDRKMYSRKLFFFRFCFLQFNNPFDNYYFTSLITFSNTLTKNGQFIYFYNETLVKIKFDVYLLSHWMRKVMSFLSECWFWTNKYDKSQ